MGAEKIENTNPLLDKRLINAFVDGVIKTLSSMAQTTVETGKPFIENELSQRGSVAGLIGMVCGSMKGNLTISFEPQAAFTIINNMLGEMPASVDDSVADAVGELTNMIYGSAKTVLNQLGYAFQMAIPTVIRGDYKIVSYHKGASLVIPFKLPDDSKFYIEITIQP